MSEEPVLPVSPLAVSEDYPHPAQLLFERIVRTWVLPHVRALQPTQRLHLQTCLILWGADGDGPQVFLNDDVSGQVEGYQAQLEPSAKVPGPIFARDIRGLESVTLQPRLRQRPFVFFVQGQAGCYFLVFQRLDRFELNREFLLLRRQLATRGLELTAGPRRMSIYLDLTPNRALVGPTMKRRRTAAEARDLTLAGRHRPAGRVKRERRLPAIITSTVPQVTELLVETRGAYVDGHYFSTVAAAATTADRICLHLASRYELQAKDQRWLREKTFGQKLDKLRSLGVLDEPSALRLRQLNRIRNRHLHPQEPVSGLTAKRDALRALRLLHEFVEQTVSMFRDHHMEEGRFAPKPIT